MTSVTYITISQQELEAVAFKAASLALLKAARQTGGRGIRLGLRGLRFMTPAIQQPPGSALPWVSRGGSASRSSSRSLAGEIRSTLWCMSTRLRLIWRRSCRNDKNPHQPVGQWGAISGQDVARMAPRAATITSP